MDLLKEKFLEKPLDEICINTIRTLFIDAIQKVRLVFMPSWELFEAQSQEYRDSVLPPSVSVRLAVEAGVSQGWERYIGAKGDMISVEKFGVSAPGPIIMQNYGFTVENVCKRALALLK